MHQFRPARWLMLALLACVIPASSYAGVFISINFAPPVLPVYEQPPCPEPNLMWTPGYWAYGDEGYFWVPGAWVPAPFEGGLWTPGYWGWNAGLYVFHPGYWGYHVGYYGGVNYGGGFLGVGFAGGEWRGGTFAYNTAVMHVNTTVIHNTYVNETIVHNTTIVNNNHVAYSGGPGGIQHQPTSEERIAEHETHTAPTTFQAQHVQTAQANKMSYAKANGGHPTMLAASKPLAVESRPAPPRPAVTASNPRVGAPGNVARPATAGAPANNSMRPNTAVAPRANTTTPRPNYATPPARTNTQEYKAPPRENNTYKAPPPPKGNAHPAEKTKPEKRE
jgi:hypothetical protein